RHSLGSRTKSGLPSTAEAAKLCAVTKTAHYPGILAPAPAAILQARVRWVLVLILASALAGCGGGDGRKNVRPAAPAPAASGNWAHNAPANPAASNSVLMRA